MKSTYDKIYESKLFRLLQTEYTCYICNHTGPLELRMGGGLCEKCRIILFNPGSPEFQKEFELQRRITAE